MMKVPHRVRLGLQVSGQLVHPFCGTFMAVRSALVRCAVVVACGLGQADAHPLGLGSAIGCFVAQMVTNAAQRLQMKQLLSYTCMPFSATFAVQFV